jgi:hypothetical protein
MIYKFVGTSTSQHGSLGQKEWLKKGRGDFPKTFSQPIASERRIAGLHLLPKNIVIIKLEKTTEQMGLKSP